MYMYDIKLIDIETDSLWWSVYNLLTLRLHLHPEIILTKHGPSYKYVS